MITALRWIAVLPAAFIGMYLVSFAVAIFAGRVLRLSPKTNLILSFVISNAAFVVAGYLVAPSRKGLSALVLIAINLIPNPWFTFWPRRA